MLHELNAFRINAEIDKEINRVESRFKYCMKEMYEFSRYDTFKDEVNFLKGVLDGLKIAVKIINNQ